MAKKAIKSKGPRITGEADQWFLTVGLMTVVLGILVLAIATY